MRVGVSPWSGPEPNSAVSTLFPLCVDLDGTLVRTDTLVESIILALKRAPFRIFAALFRVLITGNRARFKQQVAAIAIPNPAVLPYNGQVLELIKSAVKQGRKAYLVTGADQRVSQSVAAETGLFAGVFSSDGDMNLIGRRKAECLKREFGEGQYDYVGDSASDLRVWANARKALVVGPNLWLRRCTQRIAPEVEYLERPKPLLPSLVRCLRPHQSVKNLLVFVPVFTSHRYAEPEVLLRSMLAFIAFCLCSSGGYCINDVLDLESDRRNSEKRKRPFASGDAPILFGLAASVVLLGSSILLGYALGVPFLLTVLAYAGLNALYSGYLRRKMFLDVVALTFLFSLRLTAGHVVTGVVPSNWLLACSLFVFLSLALLKRYTELRLNVNEELTEASGRAYLPGDLALLPVMGIACGYMAVLVLALYIDQSALQRYRNPHLLWVWCLLLFYYVSRLWLIANRGRMKIDPVVFAIRDHVTYAAVAITFLIFLLATYVPFP